MTALLLFQLRRVLRSWEYLFFTVVLPALFTVFFTQVFGGQAGSGAEYQEYARTYMVAMMAYGGLGAALGATVRLSFDRASGWLRQVRVLPISGREVVAADTAVGMVLVLPSLVVVALVGRFVNGVQLGLGTWAALVGALWVGSAVFVALGMLLGLALEQKAAGAAMGIVSVVLAALGGLWIPVEVFPDGFRRVAQAVPSYWYGELGRDVVAGTAPGLAVAVLAGFAVLFAGAALAVGARRPLHAVAG
ncbi:ABC transporter permease [Klenkia taihuensis]|uniref:ABC-2 type transport system permease protein n=1 Tax=Klenkia taihuensis TaxID=1225127 RepID=A0A1I1SCT4_9ACTN|nr:ABC transporter permease [Klenkia taihuensis]GHE13511.1 ABC transporter [Klenkia taihuensis]SFD44305.1 ABC-2 type transport system permease protein [Klenkia taihuensis]